jgi:hypothetical protein
MSDNSKLAAAAEALVRAAVSKMKSSVVAMDREVIQGIQSIAADLKGRNDDEKTLEALGVLNGKVDVLNSNISQMHKSSLLMQVTMCGIDSSLKTQDKHRRIEFALGHCNLGTFQYSFGIRSEDLVKKILLNFRKGSGYYISIEKTLSNCSGCSNETKLTSHQQFRDALTAQLFTLLGVEPVWDAEPEEDGGRVIRYP